MGINISGKGVLSGIASLVIGAVNNLNLLITKIIGYTNTGGGGSSYYTTTVGFSAKRFVTKNSDGSTLYSDDGMSWIDGGGLPQGVSAPIMYGLDKFVAITFLGQTVYSEDGISWSLGTNLSQGWWPSKAAYGNGKYVFVSQNGYAAYSTNGIDWTLIENFYSNAVGVAFGNGVFVAMTSNGKFVYSEDGITWTLAVDYDISGWLTIQFLSQNFFAINDNIGDGNGRVAWSFSGSGWNVDGILPLTNWPYPPTFGNGIFSIVSYNGRTSYSNNGVYWQDGDNLATTINSSVTYGDGKFLVLTSSGQIKYSLDGNSWTTGATLPDISGGYSSISFGNNIFTYIDYNGKTFFSTDGITWTQGETLSFKYDMKTPLFADIQTLKEVQISIGNQGQGGAEILAPVDIYIVPSGLTTTIDEVRVKNNSLNTITYDLAILDEGVQLTDQNALINDQTILAGSTATITNITTPMTSGQRIVVFPSAVDVVEVKVYGTEA